MALCDMSWPSRIRGRSTNRSRSNDSSEKSPDDDSKGQPKRTKAFSLFLPQRPGGGLQLFKKLTRCSSRTVTIIYSLPACNGKLTIPSEMENSHLLRI